MALSLIVMPGVKKGNNATLAYKANTNDVVG